jgi:error-prone DNA polymerase
MPWRELNKTLSWTRYGELELAADEDQPQPSDASPRPVGPPVPYAELHAHSAYSFLDGASSPRELVA